jgi:hypothetical protein
MQPQTNFTKPTNRVEVWAQLSLCATDCALIRDVLSSRCGIKGKVIVPKMHITVYHARRPMLSLHSCAEAAHLVIPTAETRFMVLAPGGENPQPVCRLQNPRLRKHFISYIPES